MAELAGDGRVNDIISSTKKNVHPSTHPPLQNIWYYWPQALNRGSLACRGCEKCQGLKFPGQNSCRSQPDDVKIFFTAVESHSDWISTFWKLFSFQNRGEITKTSLISQISSSTKDLVVMQHIFPLSPHLVIPGTQWVIKDRDHVSGRLTSCNV